LGGIEITGDATQGVCFSLCFWFSIVTGPRSRLSSPSHSTNNLQSTRRQAFPAHTVTPNTSLGEREREGERERDE